MTLEEIAFELKLTGLRLKEQHVPISSIKKSRFDTKVPNRKHIAMDYVPVFSIYDEDLDNPYITNIKK